MSEPVHVLYDKETGTLQIQGFLKLPREQRAAVLDSTKVDHDDITGIEHIWIASSKEDKERFFASQATFFDWLKHTHPEDFI